MVLQINSMLVLTAVVEMLKEDSTHRVRDIYIEIGKSYPSLIAVAQGENSYFDLICENILCQLIAKYPAPQLRFTTRHV